MGSAAVSCRIKWTGPIFSAIILTLNLQFSPSFYIAFKGKVKLKWSGEYWSCSTRATWRHALSCIKTNLSSKEQSEGLTIGSTMPSSYLIAVSDLPSMTCSSVPPSKHIPAHNVTYPQTYRSICMLLPEL